MGISKPPSWDVNARVQAVLEQHEHPHMTDARLDAMKAAALAEFRASLTECETNPDHFELLVHVDEIVGPIAFVLEPATGQDWPLQVFQNWLKRS
jgi:hypothetical protein